MQYGRYRHWLALVVLGTLGCAGNGDGLDQNGEPIGSSGGTAAGPITADFQSIQDNVFTPICSRCHIGAGAPEGLQLDAAHSYNLLVGVPSVEESNLLRVNPGNPDSSYMVLKIQGGPGIHGGQMPLGETPLPQATINAIRQWVTDGAMRPQTLEAAIRQQAATAFNIETTAPLDAASVPAPLTRIVVTFTQDVDASLVNGTTITLERLANASPGEALTAVDGTATAADGSQTVAMTAALADQNQAVLLITPSAALDAGVYRVTLRGTGGAALADLAARTLGSDSSFTFTVVPAK